MGIKQKKQLAKGIEDLGYHVVDHGQPNNRQPKYKQ